MSPVRTEYRPVWTPPPFRPSTGQQRWIPRGSGVEEGGDPGLIGSITVIVSPLGQITVGQAVRFTAVRSGGGAPLSYQWSGPAGVIPGATSSVYNLTTTSTADSGTYTCVVTSAGASDSPQSGGAAITVVAAPVAFAILMEDGGFILMENGGHILLET
jgi:hypothetical protein